MYNLSCSVLHDDQVDVVEGRYSGRSRGGARDRRHWARKEPQHHLLALTFAKIDRLLDFRRSSLAHDAPLARIRRHLDPVERVRQLDVVDGNFDVVRRSPFDPDAQARNSGLQLAQLFACIRLGLLLSIANPQIVRRKVHGLPVQLGRRN